ncbi:hypothetical protein H4R34_005116 [Dimargaris verticillata]|uniref:LysM domain-containing protein n=1 Tax=Dimargaris verticillata TaxID=2761393 RepID=A0A9W8B184_9FUNG|nr:hypothetical protein H4R34_005116 [Dimargaris verticillata]
MLPSDRSLASQGTPSSTAAAQQIIFDLEDDLAHNTWARSPSECSYSPPAPLISLPPSGLVDDDAHQPLPSQTSSSANPSSVRRRNGPTVSSRYQSQQQGSSLSSSSGLFADLDQSLRTSGTELARQLAHESTAIRDSLFQAAMPYVQAAKPLSKDAITTLRSRGTQFAQFLQGPRRNYVGIYPVPDTAWRSSSAGRVQAKLEPAASDPLSPAITPKSSGGPPSPHRPLSGWREFLSSTLMLDESPVARTSVPTSGTTYPPTAISVPVAGRGGGAARGLRNRRMGTPEPASTTARSNLPHRTSPVKSIRAIIHPVTKQDTLAGICLKYGIQPASLRKVNRLWSSDSIHLRQQLYIPIHMCDSREVHLYNTVMMDAESPFYEPQVPQVTSDRDARRSVDSVRSSVADNVDLMGFDTLTTTDAPLVTLETPESSGPTSPTTSIGAFSTASSTALTSASPRHSLSTRRQGKAPAAKVQVPDIRAVSTDLLTFFPGKHHPLSPDA